MGCCSERSRGGSCVVCSGPAEHEICAAFNKEVQFAALVRAGRESRAILRRNLALNRPAGDNTERKCCCGPTANRSASPLADTLSARQPLGEQVMLLHRISVVFVALVLPVLFMGVAVLSWQMGNRFTEIFSIATIPFIFICWGLSHLLAGRECREIVQHMTEDERAEFNRMAMRFGAKVALFFGIPLGAASATAYYTFGESHVAFLVPLLVGVIIAMPIAYYQAKPIREFPFQTEYAKRRAAQQ